MQLRETEPNEALISFVTRTSDAVWAVNRFQKIVHWNDSAEMMFGWSPEEVLSKSCYGVLRSVDVDGCAVCKKNCLAMRMALRGEVIPTRSVCATKRNGRKLELVVTTLVAAPSEPSGGLVFHLCRDVADRGGLEDLSTRVGHGGGGGDGNGGFEELTRRELQILRHLCRGSSTNEIADALSLSKATVRNHIQNIFPKLQAHTRVEAVAQAIRNGLLEPDRR